MLRDEDYIPEPNTGCWLWLGAVDRRGYAQRTIYTPGAAPYDETYAGTYRCVRIAREIVGAQPGELACHHCDTPPCVNPEHLYRGTPQSNMDDKMRRGRWRGTPRKEH